MLILAGFALGACSPGRAVESLGVLQDIATPAAEVEAERQPHRLAHSFVVEGRSYTADLYVPRDQAKAALVLVPGAAPRGKDDSRLVAFAQAIARAKFLVLVPEIENLRDMRIGPTDMQAIGDAVVYLAGQTEASGVGLVAISYSAGPAVIVASQERTRRLIAFVLSVGGYYDIEALVTFFTTGYFRPAPGADWEYLEPNPYGRWVFLRSNLERIGDAADRATLSEVADRKLRDPDAEVGQLTAGLGAEGQAVYALLRNSDPTRVPALVAALPAAMRADMGLLNPKAYDLSRLEAKLILVHGRDDQIIPYGESVALEAAAPKGRAALSTVENLAHVDLSPLGVSDFFTLWATAYDILGLRDAMSAPRDAFLSRLASVGATSYEDD